MTKIQRVYAISVLAIVYLLVIFGAIMNLSISPSQGAANELATFYRYVLSVSVGTVLMIISSVIDPAFPVFPYIAVFYKTRFKHQYGKKFIPLDFFWQFSILSSAVAIYFVYFNSICCKSAFYKGPR